MKCLSCGDNVCWVITKNTAICDKCGAEHTQEGLFWNCCLLEARAEKAESELKAIKDRIEAVTYETIKQKIYDNAYKGLDDNNDAIWCFDDFDFKSFEKTIYELIKQIGGEK